MVSSLAFSLIFWLIACTYCALLMPVAFGQSANCILAQGTALDLAKSNGCACQALPSCGTCQDVDNGRIALASCENGCEYCAAAASTSGGSNSNISTPTPSCGIFSYSVGRTETQVFNGIGLQKVIVLTLNYLWTYTKGPRSGGTVSFRYTTDRTCDATLNGKTCQSCTLESCDTGLSSEPRIDCTNVEAGATATPCTTGRLGSGPVSLAPTEQAGPLGPLIFPYEGCLQNSAVLGTKSPTVPSAPTASPPTSGGKPNTSSQRCGLFRLGIVCLRGCGLMRRILGLCND